MAGNNVSLTSYYKATRGLLAKDLGQVVETTTGFAPLQTITPFLRDKMVGKWEPLNQGHVYDLPHQRRVLANALKSGQPRTNLIQEKEIKMPLIFVNSTKSPRDQRLGNWISHGQRLMHQLHLKP
ncbi:hypothetical protein TNCV_2611011 [Trichonephila clavipes]|nr:hypothetical protein TNCV_2611011 [Trichonephila clavipes]